VGPARPHLGEIPSQRLDGFVDSGSKLLDDFVEHTDLL
jgi:hypothetical protein